MMRFLAAAMAGALALSALTASAHEDEGDPRFDHNGSIMQLNWLNDHQFTINYVRPKSGLGVPSNAILIDGWMDLKGNISATARIFKSGCNPAEYQVTGSYNEQYFVLSGMAPASWSGCNAYGLEWNGHSTLPFARVSH